MLILTQGSVQGPHQPESVGLVGSAGEPPSLSGSTWLTAPRGSASTR